MKKIISILLCAGMIISVLSACSSADGFSNKEHLSKDVERSSDIETTFNYSDGAVTAPTEYNSYSREVSSFELKLFRDYYKNNSGKKSFVIAPANTTLSLGLLANGAAKQSQTNIINALGSELVMDSTNQCSSYFQSRLKAFCSDSSNTDESGTTTEKAYLKLNQNYFFNDTVDIRKNFLTANADYYGTDIFRFVFSDENAVTNVNSFLGKNAFSALDNKDNLICVSSSDIYDEWLSAYEKSAVTDGVFYSESGEKAVKYMTSAESYIHTEKAQGIIKYMRNTPAKFVAIMPNEGTSLESYISSLDYLEYSEMIDSFNVTSVANASIPEFSIKSETAPVSLKAELEACGLADIFTDEVNLSNITLSDDLFVNDFLEIQPSITVNSSGIGGSESVKATVTANELNSDSKKADSTLKFDRPFIFMIIDNESSIPIYIGTVDF